MFGRRGLGAWLAVPGLLISGLFLIFNVVDLFSGFNKLMDGLRVEADEKPWYR